MKITHDAQVDALYIQFLETTVTTVHLAEGIAADYDAEGRLAGIEILAALQQFDNPEVLRQIILEDVGWRWPESVVNENSDTSSVVPA